MNVQSVPKDTSEDQYFRRGLSMGAVVALIVGLVIALFGFLIMRDPTRLAWFDPGAEAYYQRTLARGPLDRFQFQMMGLVMSFFGWMLLSSGLNGILRIKTLDNLSGGFLVLLWLSFISAFVFGMICAIYEVIRGRGKDLLFGAIKMRNRFIALGPIDFEPATILRMQKETKIFTIVYFSLIGASVLISIILG